MDGDAAHPLLESVGDWVQSAAATVGPGFAAVGPGSAAFLVFVAFVILFVLVLFLLLLFLLFFEQSIVFFTQRITIKGRLFPKAGVEVHFSAALVGLAFASVLGVKPSHGFAAHHPFDPVLSVTAGQGMHIGAGLGVNQGDTVGEPSPFPVIHQKETAVRAPCKIPIPVRITVITTFG